MIDFVKRSSARRWLFPVLVLFIVLGHACDLPAYVDVVDASHAAEKSHYSGDDGHHVLGDGHHSDEQALSCGAATATSSPGQPRVATAPGISVLLQVNYPAPSRRVAQSLEDPAKFAVRPPLFLLHASLLI